MKERNEQSIEVLVEAKRNAMRKMTQASNQGVKIWWATVVNDCDEEIGNLLRKKRVQSMMRRLFLMVVIVNLLVLGSILLQGCSAGFGLGADYDLYYPKFETSKGGKFSDPDESRKQSTRHTTRMERNNNLPMVGQGGVE